MAVKTCFCSVFICCLWVGSWANKYSEPYSCYSDVCNIDDDAQFCDGTYMICRQCNVVREDCFTRLHVCNCSQFCTVEGCVLPPSPEHGRYNVNTTRVPIGVKLEVTCIAGYTVRDDNPMTCSNFSVWTGSLPSCSESNIDRNIILIITFGAGLVISLVINLIFAHRCHKMQMKKRQAYNVKQSYNQEEPHIVEHTRDAEQCGIGYKSETKRLLPSAPDERKIDVEDNSKTEHDPNERHPPMTSYQHEDGTRGNMGKSDMNYIPDGTSHAENNTLNGGMQNEGCSFSQTVGHGQNVSVVLNLTNGTPPAATNIIAKQENLSAQQHDKYPIPETQIGDAQYLVKTMGPTMQPDVSTTGPVVQPEDVGEKAKIAVGRGEFSHGDMHPRETIAF
ncbi:uncharacterized protein LOC127863256 isoform X2 [Dreissena polymorpha]|uniref:Sushi domain-containing protein n=1 Tax=Dreissena polymorpha TaxID=45954 RepID=A0A9D4BEV9_DREPO|nr:uncharacterized protein LOC127863256 isoform X2 [Dreissena polymorpha]KAH3692756.1 hypothetical protein DPMN_194508 [Dreissena polymorpha]